MKKRERVFAAMKNQPVDKIPSYFTMHFPREVAFGEAAVEEHLKFFKEVNPDIQKIMNENLGPQPYLPAGTARRTSASWHPAPAPHPHPDGFPAAA